MAHETAVLLELGVALSAGLNGHAKADSFARILQSQFQLLDHCRSLWHILLDRRSQTRRHKYSAQAQLPGHHDLA